MYSTSRPTGWRAALPSRIPALLAALTLLVVACGPQAAETPPHGLTIDYSTGSVPPPFNYTYRIDVEFDEDGARVNYLLEYQFRDQLSPEELAEQGYTVEDDIRWNGVLNSELAATWRTVARETVLQQAPEPAPGADSLEVRIIEADDQARAGVPQDREPWLEIAREVDRIARDAHGVERPEP